VFVGILGRLYASAVESWRKGSGGSSRARNGRASVRILVEGKSGLKGKTGVKALSLTLSRLNSQEWRKPKPAVALRKSHP